MRHRPAAFCVAMGLAAGAAAQDSASPVGPSVIFDVLCDRTLHYYTPGVGNQIEYTAPDGLAYLWYPERPTPITGTWSVTDGPDGAGEVCYVYPPGSFGDPEASQYCYNFGGLLDDVLDGGIRDGDPYDLASGRVPYTIPREPVEPLDPLIADYPDQARGALCTAFIS